MAWSCSSRCYASSGYPEPRNAGEEDIDPCLLSCVRVFLDTSHGAKKCSNPSQNFEQPSRRVEINVVIKLSGRGFKNT